MTVNEVKELLKIYYDIPQMIDEEFATIRHCEAQKNTINLPSVNLSGLPGGKGLPGDRTANMALMDQAKYYEDEAMNCYRRIAALREKRNWLGLALGRLDKTDRYILELAYMGSPDPKQRRRTFRRPPWKDIADKVDYSESRIKQRVRVSMLRLAMLSGQVVFSGFTR
ncbi:hypothetical protein [Faecalispora anaeroviscerum]|uniref:hypothetical protein n=1 Tax=Faecalispora anaeroviscerum TaxID=2991836 RepID=UPI0024B9CE26|nr:hypothetical protein [Faecalispora anaeroviscerum]